MYSIINVHVFYSGYLYHLRCILTITHLLMLVYLPFRYDLYPQSHVYKTNVHFNYIHFYHMNVTCIICISPDSQQPLRTHVYKTNVHFNYIHFYHMIVTCIICISPDSQQPLRTHVYKNQCTFQLHTFLSHDCHMYNLYIT